jgi:uncharacterized protein (TIGR00299 family) protein
MTGVSHVTLVPLGGIAGDMFVAAMLDALPADVEPVMHALRAVLPGNLPSLAQVTSGGIAARRFTVPPQGRDSPIHYPDLDRIIAVAALPDTTASHSRAILRLLAEAEARVHRIPVDHVHFHEIADWDTLADVVAAGHLIARLDGATWHLDPLPLGGGRMQTAHGLLAAPAPATAFLLEGLAVHDDGVLGERVTPTGAAIARYVATVLPKGRASGRLLATGYGAGTRILPGVANVLIARLVQADMDMATRIEDVTILEFDIDDMTAEELAEAVARLRQHPEVIDLVTHPLSGKKGRMATGFRLILPLGAEDAVSAACFTQTSTIGLRLRYERRRCLPREAKGETPRIKRIARPDGSVTAKAEADDLIGETLMDRRRMARRAEE